MKELFLLKYGEIALKGNNRRTFEDILLKNLRYALMPFGEFNFNRAQSTITVTPVNCEDFDGAFGRLKEIFGIAGVCRAYACKKDLSAINNLICDVFNNKLINAKTFKIAGKRADKKFPLTTPEVCREVGGFLLSKYSNLSVDVHEPELTVNVEIRDNEAFVHCGTEQGAGGIPVGCGGKGLLMLSGGLDSPVAGYMLAKRGVMISAVYFHTFPYTSNKAKDKVIDLARLISRYCGRIRLFVVNFTPIQEKMRDACPSDLFTIVMRRYMVKIANEIAKDIGAKAIITGESLGQVASQTIDAIAVTNEAADVPVFRPLIGLDKNEIVDIARKIGTFETSILPYVDCCAMFAPKHPQTKPKIDTVLSVEQQIDADNMIKEAADSAEIILAKWGKDSE